jgi:hypothetical protein
VILRAAWLVPQGNCCDPPIHCIDLADHNCLNDDDANLISQALKRRNTNLRQLELVGNNFKSIGVKTLLTCIFDSLSLNAISESNHTMTRVHMFHGHNDNLAQLDRMQKIMVALQDKDSLLQCLTNVPVELIPEVLAFPRWVVDQPQHKYLNIEYSTMRWRDMPMLYSYHHRCAKSDTMREKNS